MIGLLFYWTGALVWLLIAVGLCSVPIMLLRRAGVAWGVANRLALEISKLEGPPIRRRKLWVGAFRAGPEHQWIVMGNQGKSAAVVWPGSGEQTAWRNVIKLAQPV